VQHVRTLNGSRSSFHLSHYEAYGSSPEQLSQSRVCLQTAQRDTAGAESSCVLTWVAFYIESQLFCFNKNNSGTCNYSFPYKTVQNNK
jgi:hypothetical protein